MSEKYVVEYEDEKTQAIIELIEGEVSELKSYVDSELVEAEINHIGCNYKRSSQLIIDSGANHVLEESLERISELLESLSNKD
jgi:hypothetical protein